MQTYPQALLGYRVWRLQNRQLRPLYRDKPAWAPGPNQAVCGQSKHPAPGKACHCGFNAYHKLARAIEEADYWGRYRYQDDPLRPVHLIIGLIAARGQIEVHHDGFRCQEAQVLGLLPVEISDRHRRIHVGTSYQSFQEIAADHQVPLYRNRSEMQQAATALGQRQGLGSAPPELIPPGVHQKSEIGKKPRRFILLLLLAGACMQLMPVFFSVSSTIRVWGVLIIILVFFCLLAEEFRQMWKA